MKKAPYKIVINKLEEYFRISKAGAGIEMLLLFLGQNREDFQLTNAVPKCRLNSGWALNSSLSPTPYRGMSQWILKEIGKLSSEFELKYLQKCC